MPTTTTRKPPQRKNVRHDLDAEQVKAQSAAKIAEHETSRIHSKQQAQAAMADYALACAQGKAGRWSKAPTGDSYVDPMVDDWVARERDYYALVRVIELPQKGKRFVLAYGDTADADVTRGTGPFATFGEAAGWFLRGGR